MKLHIKLEFSKMGGVLRNFRFWRVRRCIFIFFPGIHTPPISIFYLLSKVQRDRNQLFRRWSHSAFESFQNSEEPELVYSLFPKMSNATAQTVASSSFCYPNLAFPTEPLDRWEQGTQSSKRKRGSLLLLPAWGHAAGNQLWHGIATCWWDDAWLGSPLS